MLNPIIQRAELLFNQHRFDLAADALRDALSRTPDHAYAHALLALCLANQQRYDDATAEAQIAVHLAPDNPYPHYALGAIYQDRNRFPEAEAAARQALHLAPDNANYWSLLAQTFVSRSLWQPALDAAEQGLSFDPDNNSCINLSATALMKLGKQTAAAASIEDALRRNPENALSHASQGWALLHQDRPILALEHFRESLRLDPTSEWARDGMIAALKARYTLYRFMLRYYLWMSRFTKRGQWGVILGLWVAVQILRAINAANPQLAVFVYPLLGLYFLFVLASWLADPIFNLTLLANRFGRHLLSTPQRIGAGLVGALLLLAVANLLLAFPTGFYPLIFIGIVCLFLTLPTAATTKCRQRPHLIFMALYTLALAATGAFGIALLSLGIEDGVNYFIFALIGAGLSTFASSIFQSILPKK